MGAIKQFACLLFLCSAALCHGQVDQAVTITFEDHALLDALAMLDEATEQQLSFNPQILPQERRISKSFRSEPAEEILIELLGTNYELKPIGNYLIIQKRVTVKKKSTISIAGGIKDAVTGEDLQDVSIYEINTLESTLSNEMGEFELKAKTGSEVATFLISKENYQDTIIQITNLQQFQAPISLKEEKESRLGKAIRDQVRVFSNGLAKLFTSDKVIKNARNVNMVDARMFQISLVPSIGTNRKMSSQIKNKASLNVLAGYSYGVQGFELGGIYNIDREEVRGVQIGGFGNTVGGEVHGLQMAGFVNTTSDYVKGTQIGGFINVASDSVNGFQMAGFTNLTKEIKGFQIAGFNNHTKKSAGFQLSGFINTTEEMDGFQLTGFVNVAREVRGLQMSVVNIADTVASGIPFGLLNIVWKNGLLSPGFESDDVVPYRFTFRSGIDKFYTVLSIGADPGDHWSLGVGFGSKLFTSEKKKFHLNPELRWVNLAKGSPNGNANNYLVRFNFNLGYELFRRLTITSGPAVTYYITNQLDEDTNPEIAIANNPIIDNLIGNSRHQLWIGYTFGVNF